MKKIKIEIFNEDLRVYLKDEKIEFQKRTGAMVSEDYYGLSCGNSIWIGECKGISTEQIVLHELTHFVDWLFGSRLEMDTGSLWNSTELRAYTMQWLFGRVMMVVEGK